MITLVFGLNKIFKMFVFLLFLVLWVHAFLFHIASAMVRSLLHHSQVDLIYSVTPCLVGRVRMDSVLGSAGKTKPAALSPLSLSVSINQPLFPSPLSAPHYPPVSSPVFCFSVPMSYQTNIKIHTINIPLLCIPSDTHTKAHTQKTGHEKVAGRGPDGETICPGVVYQSSRPQRSARPP